MSHSLSPFKSVVTVITFAAISAQGCGRAEFSFQDPGNGSQPLTEPPVVCAPFDPAETGSSPGSGLSGKIRYLEGGPYPSTVDAILEKGKDAGVKLVLNSINVPTTAFTRGFAESATSTPLKKADGSTLVEWFGIDVRSDLILSDSDAEGYYQFALLSDDGSVLTIDTEQANGGTVLVNNDGSHPTKMGCSTSAVFLKKNETRSIRLKYYQGPKNQIALMLLWRKVGAANTALDASCGLGGTQYFFNSTVFPSVPKAPYNDLLARGWKVVSGKNFVLPADIISNPCNQ
jgi:hypothetical protein